MSEEMKFVVPTEGLLVRDPRTFNALPPEGMLVPWIGPEGRYWRRRVADGSCILSEPSMVVKETTPVSVETDEKPDVKEAIKKGR